MHIFIMKMDIYVLFSYGFITVPDVVGLDLNVFIAKGNGNVEIMSGIIFSKFFLIVKWK